MFLFFIIFMISSKPFVSNFIEFNLPNNWDCEPINDDWTCQTLNPEEKKDAIIVLTYRLSNPKDNLLEFLKYLKLPRKTKFKDKEIISKPMYSKFKNILGQEWVDSLHENAQIPNYMSRYLATLKMGRSILIAFTVKKDKYNLYMPELYNMIETLKLREGLPPVPMKGNLQGLVGQLDKDLFKKIRKKDKDIGLVQINDTTGNNDNILLIAISSGLIFFLFILIILRKRRKNNNKRSGRIS